MKSYAKEIQDGFWSYGDLEIHAWFTRSYFLNKPLDKELKTAFANYLKWAADRNGNSAMYMNRA